MIPLMDKITRDQIQKLRDQYNGNTFTFYGNTTVGAQPTNYPTWISTSQTMYSYDEIDVLINIINSLIDEINKKQDKQ